MITLSPDPFRGIHVEGLIDYYTNLGFEWSNSEKKEMVLQGEALKKLALEFKEA